jgi:hypothetical protein
VAASARGHRRRSSSSSTAGARRGLRCWMPQTKTRSGRSCARLWKTSTGCAEFCLALVGGAMLVASTADRSRTCVQGQQLRVACDADCGGGGDRSPSGGHQPPPRQGHPPRGAAFTLCKRALVELCSDARPSDGQVRRVLKSVPAETVQAFWELRVDAVLLATELLLMMQHYPQHADDLDFIAEQLFAKVPLDSLTLADSEVAEAGSQPVDETSMNRGRPSAEARWFDGAVLENRGVAMARRRSSGASSGGSSGDGPRHPGEGHHRRRSSGSRSRSRGRSRSRSHSRSEVLNAGPGDGEGAQEDAGRGYVDRFERRLEAEIIRRRSSSSSSAASAGHLAANAAPTQTGAVPSRY